MSWTNGVQFLAGTGIFHFATTFRLPLGAHFNSCSGSKGDSVQIWNGQSVKWPLALPDAEVLNRRNRPIAMPSWFLSTWMAFSLCICLTRARQVKRGLIRWHGRESTECQTLHCLQLHGQYRPGVINTWHIFLTWHIVSLRVQHEYFSRQNSILIYIFHAIFFTLLGRGVIII